MSGDLFRFEIGTVDDSGDQQKIKGQGYAGEEHEDVPRAGHYGFASNPPPGSHAIAHSPLGRADRAYIASVEHVPSRPKNLPPGASALHDTGGVKVLATPGKGVAVKGVDGDASIGGKEKTYLGGDGTDGTYSPVMTVAGPSSVVFAKV